MDFLYLNKKSTRWQNKFILIEALLKELIKWEILNSDFYIIIFFQYSSQKS